MGKFLSDFKEFAMKGNVVDMAIGVIIGGAFGKIVSSLVDDIIMPVMGILTGGIDFKTLSYTIPNFVQGGADVSLNYGMFLQNIIDFLIIAFSIFIALRVLMRFKKKKDEPEPVAVSEPSNEEKLLSEIRDLLKEKNK